MTYFQWTSAIEIGHAQIDEQHKRLFLLGEAVVLPLINSAERKPAAVQLQALIDFTQEHFAFEEGLMRSAGFPEADRHAKFHASLLTELRTYCLKVRQSKNTNPVAMISFLWNWLILHINSADRELVVWLNSHESDGGVTQRLFAPAIGGGSGADLATSGTRESVKGQATEWKKEYRSAFMKLTNNTRRSSSASRASNRQWPSMTSTLPMRSLFAWLIWPRLISR